MGTPVNTPTNYWKYKQLSNYEGKTFALIVMQPGFTVNKDTHTVYAGISASEIATAYGYTAGTGIALTVTGGVATQDNTNDAGVLAFDNVSFTPSGGNISLGGAFIWDSTDDILLGYMDSGGTVTILDGQPYLFKDLVTRSL